MDVPVACRTRGFDSLTHFVQGSQHDSAFVQDYRQTALAALDYVSETLRCKPEQKRAASDAMEDLRQSLHALKTTALAGRQANLETARDAVNASRCTHELVTSAGTKTLRPGEEQKFDTLQTIPQYSTVETILENPKAVIGATVRYGAECATLLENVETKAAKAAKANGQTTLPMVDQTAPLVQTVLAHPAFGSPEAGSAQFFVPGLYQRTEGSPVPHVAMLEQALTQVNALREVLVDMRPMPSSPVGISIGRSVQEDATVQYRTVPLVGELKTRTEPVHWYRKDGSTTLDQWTGSLDVPELPDWVSLK